MPVESVWFTNSTETRCAAIIDGVAHDGVTYNLNQFYNSPVASELNAWLQNGGVIGAFNVDNMELKEYVADKRWQKEIGGTVINGDWYIATDRDSQTKLIAEFVSINAGLRTDPSYWKFADGVYRNLTNNEMLQVILAARTHIANAFALEANLLYQISNDLVNTRAEIDAAFTS